MGTSSKRHDCLPPWEYAVVQRAQRTRQHQLETCGPSQAQRQPHSQTKTATSGAVAGTAPSGGSKLTLERLLGARAFAAYNAGGCDAVAASPVSLLHTWLPSALLGSRESSVAGGTCGSDFERPAIAGFSLLSAVCSRTAVCGAFAFAQTARTLTCSARPMPSTTKRSCTPCGEGSGD